MLIYMLFLYVSYQQKQVEDSSLQWHGYQDDMRRLANVMTSIDEIKQANQGGGIMKMWEENYSVAVSFSAWKWNICICCGWLKL